MSEYANQQPLKGSAESSQTSPLLHGEQTARKNRRMERAELMGSHSHRSGNGVTIHIWVRDGKYLARGRYEKQPFGEGIGSDEAEATVRLRQILVEIENGSFVLPSQRSKRFIRHCIPRLLIRQLCDAFLADKRRLCGKKTTGDYLSRLRPLIEFAEQPNVRRRWPMAEDVEREFALEFRTYLHTRRVTRNGRPSAPEYPTSPRQAYNILDCVRSLFHWARQPEIGRLPACFVNPFTPEVVGERPTKDPLRANPLPMEFRTELISHMDLWQLTHLTIHLVLPLRPEDTAGLLISEIDFNSPQITFGTRAGGRDFNKGRMSFKIPLPSELIPLLHRCIQDREAGPVFRRRSIFQEQRSPSVLTTSAMEVEDVIRTAFASASSAELQTPQDQKRLFRSILRRLGGVSQKCLSEEFASLLETFNGSQMARFYDLRGAVTTDMNSAGVSFLAQRYFSGHTTKDILNEYVALDVVAEMQRYIAFAHPLLIAIQQRAIQLGVQDR